MLDDGKVLQFKSKNRRFSRRSRYNFNYYAPFFYVSLSINILLLTLLIFKSF